MQLPRNEAITNASNSVVTKSPTSAGTHYSNIERDALSIFHGQQKFHHYCFTCEGSMTTDYKTLVVIFEKDVTSLSHRLLRKLIWIHQYIIQVLNMSGPQLFIADGLSWQDHETNTHEEIPRTCISINTLVMHTHTSFHDTRRDQSGNLRWGTPRYSVWTCVPWLVSNKSWCTKGTAFVLVIQRWGHSLNGITMKGRRLIVPASLQKNALKKLHLNLTGIEKTWLLVCKYNYWANMTAYIGETVKNCPTCLDCQSTWLKIKKMSNKTPGRPLESVGDDLFTNNKKAISLHCR